MLVFDQQPKVNCICLLFASALTASNTRAVLFARPYATAMLPTAPPPPSISKPLLFVKLGPKVIVAMPYVGQVRSKLFGESYGDRATHHRWRPRRWEHVKNHDQSALYGAIGEIEARNPRREYH